MKFKWNLDESPPPIEEHSRAKLSVLRSYLRAYFDRLSVNLARDEFRLDLVDGFAGGGIFQDGNEIVPGTPLIMLEESETAKTRLNQGRIKHLNFDFKYYFIDKAKAHTDHLKKVLIERGYQVSDNEIVIRNSLFQDAAKDIIAEIHRRQPRAGRAIFLLDQTGFSQVDMNLVAQIFQKLPTAEVIFTFAADALVNFLADRPAIVQAVAPLDLTPQSISDLIQLKEGDGGRALVQRVFRDKIRSVTNATYDTPFFIRPERSRRTLWFLHLSRHPTAWDVMMQCHWNNRNTFEHYGPGGFEMMGWDNLNSGTLPLLRFGKIDERQMRKQILDAMPDRLFALASEGAITIDAVRHELANETAARFSDMDSIILELSREKEIEILDADNKVRSSRLRKLRPHDRIAIPKQMRMFFDSQRRG